MELDRPAQLRTPAAEETGASGAGPLRPAFPVDAVSELVADVVEQTGLLSPADVTLARSAAKTGSFAQALVDEGLAAPERVATALSARFGMPVVDLPETGVSADAAKEVPLHVLERILAIPYAIENGLLRVAIADPQNVNAIAFYRKRGRPRCGHSGYRGRIGVYQLLVMTEELESLAVARARREDIERAAMDGGMRTLWDDGLAKVAAGITSLEELSRVLV